MAVQMVVSLPRWITILVIEPEIARDVHDTTGFGLPQQRQHRLRHRHRAQKIGSQHALDDVDTRSARRPIMRVRDASVIHQDVKLAEARLGARPRRRDGLYPCDVHFDKPYVESFARKGIRGVTAGRRIACPEQIHVTRLGIAACDFEADAFVGAPSRGPLAGATASSRPRTAHDVLPSFACLIDRRRR